MTEKCNKRGCCNPATLAIVSKPPEEYKFLCDDHRPDKEEEKRRTLEWHRDLKERYGIDMECG